MELRVSDLGFKLHGYIVMGFHCYGKLKFFGSNPG